MNIYILEIICLLLFLLSLFAWYRRRSILAILLLMGAALLLRLLMASLDPFLHDWDERFHAAVARNMLAQPWQPMLRPVPLLPYNYKAWAGNYIWLHKQPLFLWQIALSLKLFGINTLALRLPSVLLSTALLWPVYRLGCLIFNSPLTGYVGAVLTAFAYYQLEMVSGALGMDHNDVAFLVYVTASIWAYYEYRIAPQSVGWLVLVGLLSGAAVLCKWLPGLLVYAGWVLDLLLRSRQQKPLPEMGRLLSSLAVAIAVLLPWQLYIKRHFPLESAYEQAYNTRHFTEVLEGHGGPWYFHVLLGPIQYGLLIFAILPGAILVLRQQVAWPLLAMIILTYGFFTFAATKMYSYTYMISPLLLLLGAWTLVCGYRFITRYLPGFFWQRKLLGGVGILLVAVLDLRPWGIVKYHVLEQGYGVLGKPLHWSARQANAAAYRQLMQSVPHGTVVINVPYGDEQAALFFSGHPVYPGPLTEADVHYLRTQGYRVATYPAHPGQELPVYLRPRYIIKLYENLVDY